MTKGKGLFVGAMTGAAFYAMSGIAGAATITLMPATQTVTQGDPVTITAHMDFTGEATLGGGFDVFFDPSVLSFVSHTYNASLGDPLLRRNPDILTGEINGLSFGDFGGPTGPALVVTLVFNTLSATSTLVSLNVNGADGPDGAGEPGGFLSAIAPFGPQAVSFTGAAVNITPVPLPAAGWLMLGGLGALVGMARRQKAAPAA